MITAIRPAIDTLRELRGGQTLDELAVKIHDAVSAVTVLGKPATVTLTMTIKPLTKNMKEPAMAFEAEVTHKLPKPDSEATIFYTDADGNPTTELRRQRDLGITIAADNTTEDRKHG